MIALHQNVASWQSTLKVLTLRINKSQTDTEESIQDIVIVRKSIVLFNDALNTFYLRLYGVELIVIEITRNRDSSSAFLSD